MCTIFVLFQICKLLSWLKWEKSHKLNEAESIGLIILLLLFFYWFFYNRKWVDHHCQYPVLNWLKKSNKALKRAVIVHLIVQLIKMLMCDGSYLMNYKAFRYSVIFLHLICLIPYFLFFSKPTFKTASGRDCSSIC